MAKFRLFENDQESAPKGRTYSDDIVGRFRSGRLVGNRPEALNEWRITTGDPAVADAIVQLYGGRADEWETSGEDGLEILTPASKIGIIVDGPGAVDFSMRQYGNGVLFHHCDGIELLAPEEDKGKPCGCPQTFKERRALAKRGGPKPNVDLRFKLQEDPELGVFRLVSASWDLVWDLQNILDDLEDIDGPARCDLAIKMKSFVPKAGPMANQTVTYPRPVLDVQGPWNGSPHDN